MCFIDQEYKSADIREKKLYSGLPKISPFKTMHERELRGQFQLEKADRDYIQEIGIERVRAQAILIIKRLLSPANPENDGKQTPMWGKPKGHPVFIAQHATGTCCRECLEKYYGIPKGKLLTDEEQLSITRVVMEWIQWQMMIDTHMSDL